MAWILSAFADEAGVSIDEQVAVLKQAGVNFIDPRVVESDNISELPLDVAQTLKQKCDEAGIGINMLGSPIGKIDVTEDFDIDRHKLKHLAEVAKVLQCHAIRIFSYFNKTELPMDQWQQISLDRLQSLRDDADKLGLTLYHENESHIFGDKLENVLKIIETCRDGKTFCAIYDFDNYNRTDDNPKDIWAALRDKTDAFHLKDSNSDGMHVPIATGSSTNSRQILEQALADGFSGSLSLEPHLKHSKAVMATGPSGQQNQALSDMSAQDCFLLAAETAINLLDEIGAPRK